MKEDDTVSQPDRGKSAWRTGYGIGGRTAISCNAPIIHPVKPTVTLLLQCW